ncbi:hypothetical protein KSC_110410 [Ktedonobacter sp. SOSP1-52]|uniref:serine/threonine protein kinase n=1 Tax=Ktedonobacter sp. SOSP1-52 TaxID=2778366 RepID=UPI001916317C|nr:serine/threonine-protein kinase [Ktedonobacter sp. SOSP1-52]GHO72149.1 hypothetical protein KSC_110410 [Ktedonobacter sp. SOSP1-52]
MINLVGQQLGNYRLLHLLGHGSFAEIYLGQHIWIQSKQAAIKILRSQIAEEYITDFQQEAEFISLLHHPHIVPILDYAVERDTAYLVMDYYSEGTLRKRHPRGSRLPLAEVVSYIKQVAEALQFAHDHKLIHRDVKPENMLIGHQGEILLSDFGIAAMAHQTSSMSTQKPTGTVPYMAPEQIKGAARPTSDQYALAAIAYEWLAGERPFNGTHDEIYAQHLMSSPPPLREKINSLPIEVEQVIMQGLAKEPAQRFPSISDFALALEAASLSGTVGSLSTLPRDLADPMPTFSGEASIPITPPEANINPSLSHSLQTPTKSTQPPPLSTHVPEPQSRDRRNRPLGIALIACALLLIPGVLGLFTHQNHEEQVQKANATATTRAQQTTTTRANVNATATFTHLSPLEQYNQLKRTPPTLNDPMRDNSQGGHWDEEVRSFGACKFLANSYHNIVTSSGYFNSCGGGTDAPIHDFAFEIQVAILQGDSGGLSFGYNNQQGYHFAIRADGTYLVLHYTKTENSLETLTEGSCVAIKQGFKQINTLAIIVRGNNFSFFVNSQYAANWTDTSYNAGYLGVYAASAQSPTEVAYSNARVWKL